MVSVTIWMFLVLTLHGRVSGDKPFKKTPGKPRIKTNNVHHVYRPYINGEVLNVTKVQHLEGINRHHPPFNERRIQANSLNRHSVQRGGKSLQSNKGMEIVSKVDTENAQKDVAYHRDKEPDIPLDDQSRRKPQLPGWLKSLGASASEGRFPSAGEINGYNIAPNGRKHDGKIVVSLPKPKEMNQNKVAYSNGIKQTKTLQRHKPKMKNDYLSHLSPELELMPMVLEADQPMHQNSKNSGQIQEPNNNPDSSVQRQAHQIHQKRKENRPSSNTRNNPKTMGNFQPEAKKVNKELPSNQGIYHEKRISTAYGIEAPDSTDKPMGTVVEEFTNEQPGLTPDLKVGGEEYDRILLSNKQTKESVPDDEDEKHVEKNLPLSKKYAQAVHNNQGIQRQYQSETDESRGYLPSQGNPPEKPRGIQNAFLGDEKMPVDFRGDPDVSPDSLPHARPHDRGNYEQRREQLSPHPISPDLHPPNMGRSLQVGTGQVPGHFGGGRSIPNADRSPPKPDYEELKRKMINELKFPQAINQEGAKYAIATSGTTSPTTRASPGGQT
ncbi:uncharacterized protein LOC106151798 [Lingula anatina]|uniref:Uncharacterized protein LOC106151798 n=1 Tax=Lingula anatina TaxID=7574 RepID=A0A1S3H3Y1_LINAN|nr:uncharacterized protein LOC106151798 [Lingula anatina]|eukprot:XP_013380667.1 uncharacterized protein LOC106151798 [Lingula anatina]